MINNFLLKDSMIETDLVQLAILITKLTNIELGVELTQLLKNHNVVKTRENPQNLR